MIKDVKTRHKDARISELRQDGSHVFVFTDKLEAISVADIALPSDVISVNMKYTH